MKISYSYFETVDIYDRDGIRTSYGSSVSCIRKYKQDVKDYNVNTIFGYDIRASVCTEEYACCDAIKNNIGLEEHKKIKDITYRLKKRRTYSFSQNFQIDMTEVVTSISNRSVLYQVEIELKEFHYVIDIDELNRTILLVLKNLFGKSELL